MDRHFISITPLPAGLLDFFAPAYFMEDRPGRDQPSTSELETYRLIGEHWNQLAGALPH